MLDPFLALDLLKNPRNFIGTLRWDQDGNRAALALLGRIAKNPLGTRVPAHDNAVQGHANDGVTGGIHNRRQLGSCCPNLLAHAHLTIERARNAVKERTYSWLLYTELDTVDHSKTCSAKRGTPLKEGALGILRVIPMQLIIESAQSAPGLRRNHFISILLGSGTARQRAMRGCPECFTGRPLV